MRPPSFVFEPRTTAQQRGRVLLAPVAELDGTAATTLGASAVAETAAEPFAADDDGTFATAAAETGGLAVGAAGGLVTDADGNA